LNRTFCTVDELQEFIGMLDPMQVVTFTVWSNVLYPQPQLSIDGVHYDTGRKLLKQLPVVDAQERVVVSG
jgi:hypothetical protein